MVCDEFAQLPYDWWPQNLGEEASHWVSPWIGPAPSAAWPALGRAEPGFNHGKGLSPEGASRVGLAPDQSCPHPRWEPPQPKEDLALALEMRFRHACVRSSGFLWGQSVVIQIRSLRFLSVVEIEKKSLSMLIHPRSLLCDVVIVL